MAAYTVVIGIAEALDKHEMTVLSAIEEQLALQIRATGLEKPERELRFAVGRRWRFDFAWPDRLIAMEVEGGTRSGGRHVRPVGFDNDCEKYNAAALAGWMVFRVTGSMVKSGEAISLIEKALRGVSKAPCEGGGVMNNPSRLIEENRWKVVRFPDGEWHASRQGRGAYEGCEVFEVIADDAWHARKKAMAQRYRNRKREA